MWQTCEEEERMGKTGWKSLGLKKKSRVTIQEHQRTARARKTHINPYTTREQQRTPHVQHETVRNTGRSVKQWCTAVQPSQGRRFVKASWVSVISADDISAFGCACPTFSSTAPPTKKRRRNYSQNLFVFSEVNLTRVLPVNTICLAKWEAVLGDNNTRLCYEEKICIW